MIRPPRSLFRSRHRPRGVLYVGPSTTAVYLPELAKLAGRLQPGTVRHATIAHDPWCRIFRGGPCVCCPEIVLTPSPEEN